jgi:hypothetical protein
MSVLTFNLFASLAEFERDVIRVRLVKKGKTIDADAARLIEVHRVTGSRVLGKTRAA